LREQLTPLPLVEGDDSLPKASGPRMQDFGLIRQTRERMSSSDGPPKLTTTTEITLVTGDRYRVQGDVKDVERIIVDAARGSIMQLAWLVEAETGEELAVNPEHVVTLRPVRS
jgi:hypothetical protein